MQAFFSFYMTSLFALHALNVAALNDASKLEWSAPIWRNFIPKQFATCHCLDFFGGIWDSDCRTFAFTFFSTTFSLSSLYPLSASKWQAFWFILSISLYCTCSGSSDSLLWIFLSDCKQFLVRGAHWQRTKQLDSSLVKRPLHMHQKIDWTLRLDQPLQTPTIQPHLVWMTLFYL